jgi:hypothetical protein
MVWGNQSSKSKEISDMAKARCREREITFAVALVEIVREHPRLAHEAREEVLGTSLEVLDSDRRTWVSLEGLRGAGDDLLTTAKKRAREKTIGFTAALSEISRERPELVRMAREETLGTKL